MCMRACMCGYQTQKHIRATYIYIYIHTYVYNPYRLVLCGIFCRIYKHTLTHLFSCTQETLCHFSEYIACIYICVYIYVCVCIQQRLHSKDSMPLERILYIYIYKYVCVCIPLQRIYYICIYACIYVCKYIYINIYIYVQQLLHSRYSIPFLRILL